MSKIHVIAGSYEQFRMFRQQLTYAMAAEDIPIKYHDIVYVSGPDALRGIREPWGYIVGTWYQRNDIADIDRQVRIAGSTLDDFISVEL